MSFVVPPLDGSVRQNPPEGGTTNARPRTLHLSWGASQHENLHRPRLRAYRSPRKEGHIAKQQDLRQLPVPRGRSTIHITGTENRQRRA